MTEKTSDSLEQIGRLLDTKEPEYLMSEDQEQKNASEKRIEYLEAEVEELKELMRENLQKSQIIDDPVPYRVSSMMISTSVKADISREKERNESMEKTISRILSEVREYRQIFSELFPLLDREGDAEKTLEEIKKILAYAQPEESKTDESPAKKRKGSEWNKKKVRR